MQKLCMFQTRPRLEDASFLKMCNTPMKGHNNKITVPTSGLDFFTTVGNYIVKEEQIFRAVEEFEETGKKTLAA
jgi:hypothetical protein